MFEKDPFFYVLDRRCTFFGRKTRVNSFLSLGRKTINNRWEHCRFIASRERRGKKKKKIAKRKVTSRAEAIRFIKHGNENSDGRSQRGLGLFAFFFSRESPPRAMWQRPIDFRERRNGARINRAAESQRRSNNSRARIPFRSGARLPSPGDINSVIVFLDVGTHSVKRETKVDA